MSSIDLHNEEIGIKIVYYGPGLGGKTSSLQHMHNVLKPENRGRMISLATGIDRTLYFDFLPIQLPKIKNYSIRMSVYTVPGQVHYDATRKLVLQGADGVVFVADSQSARQDANIESMENLRENLKNHGMDPHSVPMIIQYNKRDLDNVMPIEQMDKELNFRNVPFFETSATLGDGVYESLKAITKLVLADLKRKGIYRDDSPSIAPRLMEETAPHVTISGPKAQTTNSTDSETFEITTKESLNPHQTQEESSGTLTAALMQHAEIRHCAPPVPTKPALYVTFSNLWTQGHQGASQIEELIREQKYNEAVVQMEQLLKVHIQQSGGTYGSLQEALLSLGVCSSHYLRWNANLAKAKTGKISLTEALFGLFFLTDIELRMQAAGLK